MKSLFFAMITLVVLAGCSSDYEKAMEVPSKLKKQDKNLNPIFDGEAEPAIPNQIENDKTILGIDINNNGIRDDVDVWINRTALDYNERMAMRLYASSLQRKLKVCSLNIENDTMKAVQEVIQASICLNALSDYRHIKEFAKNNISALTITTHQRKTCLGYYDNKPSVISIKGLDFHEFCTFKIENEDSVIKSYKVFWGWSE